MGEVEDQGSHQLVLRWELALNHPSGHGICPRVFLSNSGSQESVQVRKGGVTMETEKQKDGNMRRQIFSSAFLALEIEEGARSQGM